MNNYKMKQYPADGVTLIRMERNRQITDEGWTAEHDDTHRYGVLARAAACYCNPDIHTKTPPPTLHCGWADWPWSKSDWKPSKDKIKNLVRAGALIAAEIDRLRRLSKAP